MQIVILDGYTLNPNEISLKGLEELGQLTVYDRTPPELVLERMSNCQIVITNKTIINRETIEKCPDVKYIGVLATGYNIVDTVAAKENGIVVTNVPAYSTNSVAQLVFSLLLEICHNVGAHNAAVKHGDWVNCPDFYFSVAPLIELSGKTIGIIGFGQIGQSIARIASAFGLNVLAYNGGRKKIDEDGTFKYAGLEELYQNSDIITLHAPLNNDTQGLICAESIGKMKQGVILINTSRGGLIVEADLREALDLGKVFAAACDVVSLEPMKADNPLLHAKNIYITPHIGWATLEARLRLIDVAVSNLKSFVDGNPVNVVNQ